MKAIRVYEHGGPDVLRFEDVEPPTPGPGQALIDVEAAGVNFIDVYERKGLYKIPLPATRGKEGAGVVKATGPGVDGLKPGDRVAFQGVNAAYAGLAVVPADRLVVLPPAVTTKQAAALMLQGLTAHYLTTSTYALRPGDTCLVHAAAGGVGLLLCQIARRRGARVIGTVSTDEKAALAREAGADDVIKYTEQDFEAEVKRLTGGAGVQVVYDSVGLVTFDKGLSCLARRGVTDGSLRVRIGREFPLAQAAEAHRELEARRTTGKVLLIP